MPKIVYRQLHNIKMSRKFSGDFQLNIAFSCEQAEFIDAQLSYWSHNGAITNGITGDHTNLLNTAGTLRGIILDAFGYNELTSEQRANRIRLWQGRAVVQATKKKRYREYNSKTGRWEYPPIEQ